MMIRSAKSEELDVLMPIFEGAKAFMREAGNANQCLNGEECSDKKKTPYETTHTEFFRAGELYYQVQHFRK